MKKGNVDFKVNTIVSLSAIILLAIAIFSDKKIVEFICIVNAILLIAPVMDSYKENTKISKVYHMISTCVLLIALLYVIFM